MIDRFEALLASFQGSRVQVKTDSGESIQCKLRQTARDSVTGDRVLVEMAGKEPVVEKRLERQSEFFRTDTRGRKKMIAANLDCLAVVVAPQPEPHLGLIDRYLVGAELCGLNAEVVINKSDLTGSSREYRVLDEIRRIYPNIGYGVTQVSAKKSENLDELIDWAANKKLAFLGQSGVGKSSLINALTSEGDSQAQTKAAVGQLSSKRLKGKHTTTSSYIYDMPFGGWIMDSPGIRDFENTQWKPEDVIKGFRELYDASLNCKYRNCQHLNDQGCAVVEAVNSGAIEISRIETYRNIMSGIQP